MVSLFAPLHLNKFKEDLVDGKKSHPAITQLAQKSKNHQINTIISSAVICGEDTQSLWTSRNVSACAPSWTIAPEKRLIPLTSKWCESPQNDFFFQVFPALMPFRQRNEKRCCFR